MFHKDASPQHDPDGRGEQRRRHAQVLFGAERVRYVWTLTSDGQLDRHPDRLAAGALLEQSIGVVLDAANLTEWERQPLYGLAERHHARLVIVQVTAPMNVVLSRLQEKALQPAAVGVVESPTDVYHRLAGRQEPINREHYTVDTSTDIHQFVEGLVLDLDEG